MERERAPDRDDEDRSKDVHFTWAGSIHTTFGGHHLGGDSNNALERYAREERHKPLTSVNSLELKPPKLFKGESVDITFTEEEARWVHHPHNDALVVAIQIGPMNVHRVFMDNGREAIRVMGAIKLPVTLGEGPLSVTQMVDFMVLDQESAHNALVGRLLLKEMNVGFRRNGLGGRAPSQEDAQGVLKNAKGEIHAHYIVQEPEDDVPQWRAHPQESQKRILEGCRTLEGAPSRKEVLVEDAPSRKEVLVEDAPSREEVPVEDPCLLYLDLDPRTPTPNEKTCPAEDTISILVDTEDPSKILKIGSQNWSQYHVSSSKHISLWRAVSGERAVTLKEEVDRLLDVGLIKESFYPEWLANPVLVKKPNGKWRTCVDFTDLNKACPKDSFPLPRIDQLVDATAGHALLSFMDAYSGYNHIPIYGPDQEHTSFITNRGLYCYIGMPFGLINAGATYQRLVNMMFKKQIGKTMEVYVDDMLVKSKEAKDHVRHLEETFSILKRYRMRLNPQKCVFGVESWKFLGFIVNHRGIEANPEKIKALLEMKSPTSVKQVQSLCGRIAALNHFVSKSSDRCEFFKAIRGVCVEVERDKV
ncbi:hypothetical protein POM88_016934 [Heracleum sosnowskyi]|uniref:Reverse transcriptase domain-containing protein n=1 Tax=Heracleum sosnowskyi TaxID=360622 RepID=A0AAD8MXI7_9APIA|nr:hypothetical protein POM88_016934 [Heracleum sosnowskyi]